MNFLQRYNLLKGTKHCPARKVGTILTAVLLVVVLAFAVHEVIDTKDAKMQAKLLVAQSQALIAEDRNAELLEVLAGRLEMIEPVGDRMAKVARIEWTLVELIKKEK